MLWEDFLVGTKGKKQNCSWSRMLPLIFYKSTFFKTIFTDVRRIQNFKSQKASDSIDKVDVWNRILEGITQFIYLDGLYIDLLEFPISDSQAMAIQ